MRKFVAACCCAIVGLEVLIAVPLVTCLVVLGLVEGMDVEQVYGDSPSATATYAAPMMPPVNATVWNGPPVGSPPLPVPLAPVAPTPATCPTPGDCPGSPAPLACTVPPSPIPSAPTPSPLAEEIAELRQQVGSPLAASNLGHTIPEAPAESIAAIERIAAEEFRTSLPVAPEPTTESVPVLKLDSTTADAPANPPVDTALDTAVRDCPAHGPSQPTLVESLQAAADQLYVKAQSLEADGEYDWADQVRNLAREIRREIEKLHGADRPPPTAEVSTTTPPRRLPTAATLNPARAHFVEPAGYELPIEPQTPSPEAEIPAENPVP